MSKAGAELNRIIDRYAGKAHFLIPVLQDIQEELGYIPPEMLEPVARRLKVPLTQVYAVATFYRAFSLRPRGRHVIKICDGTACHVKGSKVLLSTVLQEAGINSGATSADGAFTLESVHCLGACALAPVVVIDGNYYERVRPERLRELLAEYRKQDEEVQKAEEQR